MTTAKSFYSYAFHNSLLTELIEERDLLVHIDQLKNPFQMNILKCFPEQKIKNARNMGVYEKGIAFRFTLLVGT